MVCALVGRATVCVGVDTYMYIVLLFCTCLMFMCVHVYVVHTKKTHENVNTRGGQLWDSV